MHQLISDKFQNGIHLPKIINQNKSVQEEKSMSSYPNKDEERTKK
jgi:hypothetical protein